ncbi:MAG TPA: adenylate/guanylate cyclase domain-containing protein [Gemmatimonadales bacterium]|jgi:adenylate cyclase
MGSYRLVSDSGDQSFDLPIGRRLVVGRGLSSDIGLYDPTISRRHAEVTAGPDGVQVKDLGSSNGTFINGTRITTSRLKPDDAVTFGRLMFHLKAPPAPVAAETGAAPGLIVRQVAVTGGASAGVTSREGPSADSLLRVAAESAEARQAMKLSMLLDISQKLSGEFNLDRLLRTVVDMTFEIMNVDRVTILLRDETTDELVPTISRTRQGDTQPQSVPRSIADKVVREGVAVVSHNAPADSRFKGQSIRIQSVRSAMCSPLMASADRVLGLLYVDNLTTANTFSDEDLQFLVAFSGIAAIGIKNSHYAEQIRREAMVRSNFERYFAPNVAAEIAQQVGSVRAGGERRPTTVLFSDIRGFTAMAESMGPDAIARLLGEYFTEMVDVIFDYGGTLDKFMGDAIMALWGAPLAHPGDPDQALRAAVEMQQAVGRLNQRWSAEGRPPIRVGIGINHGEVFAGNIGSHRRLDYTVIGDVVNVAARLCAEAGPGEILVSESVLRVVRDEVDHEYVPEMALRGKTQMVQVYRVRSIGASGQLTSVTSAFPVRPSNR